MWQNHKAPEKGSQVKSSQSLFILGVQVKIQYVMQGIEYSHFILDIITENISVALFAEFFCITMSDGWENNVGM